MAVAFLGTGREATGSGVQTATDYDTSAANFFAAVVSHNDGTPDVPTDTQTLSWTQAVAGTGLAPYCTIWYAIGSGASNHRFTNPTGSFAWAAYMAFSGVETSSGLEDTSTASGGGFDNTNARPGQCDSAAAGALYITGACGGNGTGTIGSSFTIVHQQPGGGGVNFPGAAAYLIKAAAGNENPLWDQGNFGGSISMAVFKEGAGGGGGSDEQPAARRLTAVPFAGHRLSHGNVGVKIWGRTRDGLVVPHRLAA